MVHCHCSGNTGGPGRNHRGPWQVPQGALAGTTVKMLQLHWLIVSLLLAAFMPFFTFADFPSVAAVVNIMEGGCSCCSITSQYLRINIAVFCLCPV